MDLTFVLCPNIVGVLGLAILLVFTRFNFYLEDRKLKLFVAAALINMAIIVMEVADYLLAEAAFPSAYWLRRLTSATGFALTPLMPLFLALISRKENERWLLLPAVANGVISFASVFTGHLFFISPENSYFRGPLFWVMMAISLFYLLLLIYISITNIHSIRSSEAVFLLGIAVAMIVGNLLEIIFSFHFIIWNSCAVLLITYYLFLHIQYFKYDPLTGVFNRSMFNHEIDHLMDCRHVGILSFDLNGLKRVNDQEGHEKGDQYIIDAARMIDGCFSDVGSMYRIGGDEFVVIMKGTSEQAIRQRVEAFQAACADTTVSVACGYSFIGTVRDASQLLRDADRAMYENKRNRIMNR